MPPSLKGPRRASSNRIVRLSVRLSVCLSVIPSRLHTKCNIQSLGDDTAIKLGLRVHPWVPHTLLTSHALGEGQGQNLGLGDFCHIWICCHRGHPCFTNTCLVYPMRQSLYIWHVCSLCPHLSNGTRNFQRVTFTMTFYLLFKNFNIGHNFFVLRDKAFWQYHKFWHVNLNVTFDLLLKNFNIAPRTYTMRCGALPDFVSILVFFYHHMFKPNAQECGLPEKSITYCIQLWYSPSLIFVL